MRKGTRVGKLRVQRPMKQHGIRVSFTPTGVIDRFERMSGTKARHPSQIYSPFYRAEPVHRMIAIHIDSAKPASRSQ